MIPLVRFFVVAPPVAPLMVAAFVLIAAMGAAVLVVDPAGGAAVVTPIVVLQLFASASGFEGPARRGHYDLLLTSGEGRVRVALAHWLVSVAPGAAAGAAVGVIEVAASGEGRLAVFSAGTFAAFFLVSTLPWALAVRLPRFAPSIGWILLLAMVPMVLPAASVDDALRLASGGLRPSEAALMFLLYPLSVVGQQFQAEAAVVVAPGLALASGAMLASLWWIARADFPLEAAQ